jgi:hypothetical protein
MASMPQPQLIAYVLSLSSFNTAPIAHAGLLTPLDNPSGSVVMRPGSRPDPGAGDGAGSGEVPLLPFCRSLRWSARTAAA